jgi:hypothetical protein
MSDHDRLRRDVRMLKGYAFVTSACLLILALGAFRQPQQAKARFAELDVERINIVEPDGKLRMVLSNRPRSIGPIYQGKPFGYAGGSRQDHLLQRRRDGERRPHLRAADRPRRQVPRVERFLVRPVQPGPDLYFQYNDDNGVRRTGFTIADRANADIYDMVAERDSIMKLPEGAVRNEALQKWAAPRNGVPLMAQRIFVGRDPARNAIINLSDPNGKPRLRLKVDSLGAASLEFLDAAGTVTSRIPDR